MNLTKFEINSQGEFKVIIVVFFSFHVIASVKLKKLQSITHTDTDKLLRGGEIVPYLCNSNIRKITWLATDRHHVKSRQYKYRIQANLKSIHKVD